AARGQAAGSRLAASQRSDVTSTGPLCAVARLDCSERDMRPVTIATPARDPEGAAVSPQPFLQLCFSLAQERQQVLVEPILVRVGDAVRAALVDDQLASLDQRVGGAPRNVD